MDRQRFISYLLILNFGLVKTSTRLLCQVGSSECIEVSHYRGSQYATCLTNTYIQLSSGYMHTCVDRTATTCLYQCMLEIHGKENGEVYEDCSCGKINSTSDDKLPEECYSPSGEDCNWYTDCLETRYPCSNDSASYAIDFGKRFCTLYGNHYSSFSTTGKAWVDAVRKCLQVKLVPSLRPGQEKTCEELRYFAFSTHAGCYLSPDGGQSSICNLSISDFKQVFWTLKEGFGDLWKKSKTEFVNALLPTFGEMLSVGIGCAKNWVFNAVEITIESTEKLFVNTSNNVKDRFSYKKRRSVTDGRHISIEDVVFDLTNQVSSTMQWEAENIMWFGYPVPALNSSDANTPHSTLKVRIVLDPKAMYDRSASKTPIANVSAAIDGLSDAIVMGVLKFDLGSKIKATMYKVCSNITCTSSEFEAVIPNAPDKDDGYSELSTAGEILIHNALTPKKDQDDGRCKLSTSDITLITIGIVAVMIVCFVIVWILRKKLGLKTKYRLFQNDTSEEQIPL